MSAVAAGSPVGEQRNPDTSDNSNRNSTLSNGSKQSKSQVGPWRLGRTLGRGSSGRVRLAKHSETGTLAAVKIVPKSIVGNLTDDGNKDSAGLPYGIEREVIIMKLIEHPNVMALYDVWENKGELYLVLEYIEGGELFDYLVKKGKLEEREAVNYFRQIIHGVEYCHKFNICHRDLKPENLLLDKNRNIKIADFGMAALETEHLLKTSCGSPHYASPEIVAGKNYHGAPSDVWSCGVILFALLCGHLPFDDDNIRHLLLKVQSGKFKMPQHLSADAKDLITRMLQIQPEDRIAINDILKHPLLVKHPEKQAQRTRLPTNSGTPHDVSRPCKSRDDVDREILKNLQTLWHGEEKEKVIDKLLSPEMNSEKTFYCLLMKYRHDHRRDHARKKPSQTLTSANRIKSSNSVSTLAKKRHARTGSKSSVITASSSHRRSVAFPQHKRGRTATPTSPPHVASQRGSIVTGKAVTTTISPQGKARGVQASSPTKVPPKVPPHRVAPKPETTAPQAEACATPELGQKQFEPQKVREKPQPQASDDFAMLCEEAFNTEARASATGRTVSDPVESTTYEVGQRRAISLGEERRTSLFDPGSRPSRSRAPPVASTRPEPSPVTAQDGFILPMIFEEDRFADAIEEEVERVYKKNPEESKVPRLPETPEPEASRLHISSFIATSSLKDQDKEKQINLKPEFQQVRQEKPSKQVKLESSRADRERVERRGTRHKEREPLAVKDRNERRVIIQDEPKKIVTDDFKEAESAQGSKSLFKRLSLRRKHAAPETPPVSPPLSSETKQNWFMKILASNAKPELEISKNIYSKMTVPRLKRTLMDILFDWQRYGITKIVEDGSTIRGVISSRNVLKARSSRFKIELYAKRGITIAVFVKEKGSKLSFTRFVQEMESVLEQIQLREDQYAKQRPEHKAARSQRTTVRT